MMQGFEKKHAMTKKDGKKMDRLTWVAGKTASGDLCQSCTAPRRAESAI